MPTSQLQAQGVRLTNRKQRIGEGGLRESVPF
jgi:hypothetical protein